MEKQPRVRVAGILVENDKVLFIKHAKKDKEYWLLPGGGVDYGETFQTSLIREFKEEVNLEIEVKEMVYVSESIAPDNARHIVNMFFIVERKSGNIKVGEEEILKEVKFIDIDVIKNEIVYPNIKQELIELVKGGKQGIKYLGNRWE